MMIAVISGDLMIFSDLSEGGGDIISRTQLQA